MLQETVPIKMNVTVHKLVNMELAKTLLEAIFVLVQITINLFLLVMPVLVSLFFKYMPNIKLLTYFV